MRGREWMEDMFISLKSETNLQGLAGKLKVSETLGILLLQTEKPRWLSYQTEKVFRGQLALSASIEARLT